MMNVQKLSEVAREELAFLWGDLEAARRDAINGQWSIACDGIEERIKSLTPLVGPTAWEQVPIPLLELGIYQRIHSELGVDGPEVRPDMARVAEMRARLDMQAAAVRA